jgi:hypothetical protein
MLWLIPGRSIAFLICDKRKRKRGSRLQQLPTHGMSLRFCEGSAAVALTLVLFGAGLSEAVQAKTIIFDPPGAIQTIPVGINASKWITGYYLRRGGSFPGGIGYSASSS